MEMSIEENKSGEKMLAQDYEIVGVLKIALLKTILDKIGHKSWIVYLFELTEKEEKKKKKREKSTKSLM